MAKITTKLELTEKDLLEIISEKYNLDMIGAKISIYSYKGDSRDPSYSTITVEGVLKDKK